MSLCCLCALQSLRAAPSALRLTPLWSGRQRPECHCRPLPADKTQQRDKYKSIGATDGTDFQRTSSICVVVHWLKIQWILNKRKAFDRVNIWSVALLCSTVSLPLFIFLNTLEDTVSNTSGIQPSSGCLRQLHTDVEVATSNSRWVLVRRVSLRIDWSKPGRVRWAENSEINELNGGIPPETELNLL